MLAKEQLDFLVKAENQAEKSGHIFPTMAACEAALESGFGHSGLAVIDNNLFGMKQHQHPVYGTHVLPTREFIGGKWIVVNAQWIKYPDWATCFADRMATLQRLASVMPHYKAALDTNDRMVYINEVSQTWSTDHNRAKKVIDIFNGYVGV